MSDIAQCIAHDASACGRGVALHRHHHHAPPDLSIATHSCFFDSTETYKRSSTISKDTVGPRWPCRAREQSLARRTSYVYPAAWEVSTPRPNPCSSKSHGTSLPHGTTAARPPTSRPSAVQKQHPSIILPCETTTRLCFGPASSALIHGGCRCNLFPCGPEGTSICSARFLHQTATTQRFLHLFRYRVLSFLLSLSPSRSLHSRLRRALEASLSLSQIPPVVQK